MLSTLALRNAGSKVVNGIRLFSFTPKRLCTPAVTQDTEGKTWQPEKYPPSGPLPLTLEEKMNYWKEANDIFFGPQRDLKNFPHPEFKETPTEQYNFGFVPSRWFKQLYPHLGVTGCYTLFWGSVLFTLNKEWIIIDHDMIEIIYLPWLFVIARFFFRDKIINSLDKKSKDQRAMLYEIPLENAKKGHLAEIAEMKEEIWRQDAIPTIFQAKQEQVDLQLESQYRQRLHEAYETVRKRLEYQADIEFAQRHFEQQHMVNWIVDNVQKSITPQQEKETINSCIKTLKNLSASAAL